MMLAEVGGGGMVMIGGDGTNNLSPVALAEVGGRMGDMLVFFFFIIFS